MILQNLLKPQKLFPTENDFRYNTKPVIASFKVIQGIACAVQ